MFEQFLQLLNNLEDGDIKANLLTGFEKINDIHKEVITARDKAKDANAPLKEQLSGLQTATGLGENLSVDSLKELLSKGNKSNAETEALQGQLDELRGLYNQLDATHKDYVGNSEAKSFELALSQSEIFKNVSPDPFLRNAVMASIKDKLIVGDDGGLYAKGADGNVEKDIVSGEPVTGATLFNGLVTKGIISKAALIGSVGNGAGGEGNGGGGNPSNNGTSELSGTEMMKHARKE